jgi:NAD-dependent dihydropyrimidine dehydrogenase PreA subunit
MVLYDRCRPQNCDDGVCLAAQACPRKLLRQEAPYEAPMAHPSVCQACGDCVRACPEKAVKIMVM